MITNMCVRSTVNRTDMALAEIFKNCGDGKGYNKAEEETMFRKRVHLSTNLFNAYLLSPDFAQGTILR